ncbi:MAG: hypothetical protein ACLFVU_09410 [Phycisphaerae bacterium]
MSKQVVTTPIEPSSGPTEAANRFLDALRTWIYACIDEPADEPVIDNHDQGTFTVPWATYIRATGDDAPLEFMKNLRDKVRDFYVSRGEWKHGYWRMQEAHHGTEHYELFLGELWRLDPDDDETVGQFIDAAEHIGNWVDEIPDWYDWDKDVFRSLWLGTDGIRGGRGMELNVPDHFRFANLAMLAEKMSGQQKYAGLAERYVARWAEGIAESEQVPIALTAEGPVGQIAPEQRESYYAFAGQAPPTGSPVDRAENVLASAGIETLLELWSLTGRDIFRRAAERLTDLIATQLDDPDAGAGADIIRTYRRVTGSDRYDMMLLAAADRQSGPVSKLAMVPWVSRASRASGIGKRADQPEWLEDDQPRRRNPILLATAAEIRGDSGLALEALDLARAQFELACRVYPCGRHHGCSSRTVSAIARGHGRENNAGVVTAVLEPLLALAGK